ncbi:SCO7613 C-terminal domain-containing membrane protein [Nocardioides sp. URHA0020]|uniref:SCO7613 C-terminal domain-containing membrane protein n=1 Tax=Nocardioides sp. URHA0020 TaxID=1380392 RepID=UPI0004904177|nr:hypothetical protein [Nocardioides sp. URHA0020]
MPRYADPFGCPDCSARLPVDVTRCPACRLDLRNPLAGQLLQTLRTADDLLARLRVESAVQPPAGAATERTPYPAPTPPPAQPRGISGASVPRILLGLGALCLLVAAVIFLAVALTWLGIGGRTAVLVGLTLVSGGLGGVLGRRGLRVAAEALTTVSLGLLALDVIGADNAGWLGDLGTGPLVAVTSAVVLTAALALGVTGRLGAPQLVAAGAVSGIGFGALGTSDRWQLIATVVVVGYAALAVVARPGWLRVLRVAAVVGGSTWWVGLTVSALGEATAEATWRALWVTGHGYPLLAASVMVLLPLLVDRTHRPVVTGLLASATALLTITVAVPAVDESATTIALVGLAVLGFWTVGAVAAPRGWRVVALVPLVLGAAPVAAVAVALAIAAGANAFDTVPPFTGTITLRLSDPVPVAAPALLTLGVAALAAVTIALGQRSLSVLVTCGAAVGVSLVGTMALYPVPLWSITAALAVVGALLVADAVRRTDRGGALETAAGGAVLLASTAVALPSAGLTALVAAVLVLAAAAVRWCGVFDEAEVAGGLVLPLAAGGLIWSVLAAGDVSTAWRGLPVMVVVGLLAIVLPRPEIELGAALAMTVAATAAIATSTDEVTALAIHLTLAGALVTASALIHADRRSLGWPGAVLLAAATWVRLADLGVEAPEAYTLPSAATLLVLGLVRLHRDPTTPTVRALGPGLALATVPSLLWVLVDPVSVRAVLLGAGCLVLVLVGAQQRWSCPIVVGATVGALLVLRELAPYAAAVPQWVLIGIAGTLLTVVGITWEHRMRDVRSAAGYLRRLQ